MKKDIKNKGVDELIEVLIEIAMKDFAAENLLTYEKEFSNEKCQTNCSNIRSIFE